MPLRERLWKAGLPAKVRQKLKKILLFALGWQAGSSRRDLVQLGSKGAPWTIRDLAGTVRPIVVSAGISDDIEFEKNLLERYDCLVIALDPTPLSQEAVAPLKSAYPTRFSFLPNALAANDAELTYYAVLDGSGHPTYFYSSPPPGSEAMDLRIVKIQAISIESIMRRHGLTQIDLLKIDIEGGEYDVLDGLLDGAIPVAQILVEFHYRFKDIGITKTSKLIRRLKASGYELSWVSPWGEEFLFLKMLR